MKKIIALFTLVIITSCSQTWEENKDIPEISSISGTELQDVVASGDIGSEEIVGEEKTPYITQEFISENFAWSLVWDVSIVDCILSAWEETECYQFTVAPDATSDHEIWPWCPRNISDDEMLGWIWPDNGEIYQVSWEFIKNLAVFYENDAWKLYDTQTGEINVTDTQVSCEWAAKPDVEEEYKNHCVECQLSYMEDIPNVTYTIPKDPIKTTNSQEINNKNWVWVAFNGVKFDASAPAEQILAANTIAPFDDCGGHINLVAGYHYHESTGCSKKVELLEDHEEMIWMALDGFPMFTQAEEKSDLDNCGGHEVDGQYHYHVSDTGTNAFLWCYSAEYGCTSTEQWVTCDASQSERRWPPPR